MRVVVASKNPDKIAEVEAVLADLDFEIVRGYVWDDVEETGETLEANALLKAKAVVDATGVAAIADDTGLEVDHLGGQPGVHTARYAGPSAGYEANVAKMLTEMSDAVDRSARFKTAVAFVTPNGREVVAEGCLEGRISTERRGSAGFGYDPIFEDANSGLTLAEMSDDHKNQISHRALALKKLAEYLSQ